MLKLCNLAIVEVNQILFGIQMYVETLYKCVKRLSKFQSVTEKLVKKSNGLFLTF